jgi:hypothetical protein
MLLLLIIVLCLVAKDIAGFLPSNTIVILIGKLFHFLSLFLSRVQLFYILKFRNRPTCRSTINGRQYEILFTFESFPVIVSGRFSHFDQVFEYEEF